MSRPGRSKRAGCRTRDNQGMSGGGLFRFVHNLRLRWKLLVVVLPLATIPVLVAGTLVGFIATKQAYRGITQTSKDDLEHMSGFAIDLLNSHYQQFEVYQQDKKEEHRPGARDAREPRVQPGGERAAPAAGGEDRARGRQARGQQGPQERQHRRDRLSLRHDEHGATRGPRGDGGAEHLRPAGRERPVLHPRDVPGGPRLEARRGPLHRLPVAQRGPRRQAPAEEGRRLPLLPRVGLDRRRGGLPRGDVRGRRLREAVLRAAEGESEVQAGRHERVHLRHEHEGRPAHPHRPGGAEHLRRGGRGRPALHPRDVREEERLDPLSLEERRRREGEDEDRALRVLRALGLDRRGGLLRGRVLRRGQPDQGPDLLEHGRADHAADPRVDGPRLPAPPGS